MASSKEVLKHTCIKKIHKCKAEMEELVIACVGKTGWALTATKIQKQNSDVFFDTIMMDLHHWSLWLGII